MDAKQLSSKVGILLSTCERYRPIAGWTQLCIARNWSNHPPIRICGLASGGEEVGDASDWMSLTLAGVEAAHREGIRWVYLILDDLPPVSRCASRVLNETLPRLAEELQVVNIGLLGWGQRRGHEGLKLGDKYGHLLKNDIDYRWKFSLHPTLWKLSALRELLEARLRQFPRDQRTPWNFEKSRDIDRSWVPVELLENTYRISGRRMATGSPIFDALWHEPLLRVFDLWRFGLRVIGGQVRRDEFDQRFLWPYHYYRGPYPLLWSGAMRQGNPSPDFSNFLRYTWRNRMLEEWREVQCSFVK